jgi:hypothetical protein
MFPMLGTGASREMPKCLDEDSNLRSYNYGADALLIELPRQDQYLKSLA